MLTATWYRSSFFCYTITNHQLDKEISNTLLLQRCALGKFHVTDRQNTREQIALYAFHSFLEEVLTNADFARAART